MDLDFDNHFDTRHAFLWIMKTWRTGRRYLVLEGVWLDSRGAYSEELLRTSEDVSDGYTMAE